MTERHKRALRFSPNTLRALVRHTWPGNVRELENAIEYAVAVAQGQTILPDDLPPDVWEAAPVPGPGPAPAPEMPPETAPPPPSAEREHLRAALEVCHWRRAAAARQLGMSRTTLWRKMRELGLDR